MARGRPKKVDQAQTPADWILEGRGDYSEADFYTKTSDKRGHSVPVNVRLLPEAVSALERIHQSKEFPYETLQDIVRDAIVHRLMKLRELSKGGSRVYTNLQALIAIEGILAVEEEALRFSEYLKRLDTVVKFCLETLEGKQKVRELLERTLDRAEDFPDVYYRARFSGYIREKYGHHLR